jgi:hypothetical protein
MAEEITTQQRFNRITEDTEMLYRKMRSWGDRVNELTDLLISAHAIAIRQGKDTAWERFSERLTQAGIGCITATEQDTINRLNQSPAIHPDLREMDLMLKGAVQRGGELVGENDRLRAQVLDLERDRKELRRVLCTLVPRLIETECECSDDGLCDKHLVEVTLANFPKR